MHPKQETDLSNGGGRVKAISQWRRGPTRGPNGDIIDDDIDDIMDDVDDVDEAL